MEPDEYKVQTKRTPALMQRVWLVVKYMLVRCGETGLANIEIVRREMALFGGLALFLIGTFSFHAGRYCDGNTADYLSCTRPAVYYYYGVFEISLVVLGAFFVAAWVLRPRRK